MKINERRRGKQTRGASSREDRCAGIGEALGHASPAGVAPGPLTLTRVILTDPRWPWDRCEPAKPEYEEALL